MQQSQIDQEVYERQQQHADDNHTNHGAASAFELCGHIGRLVPATKGEQHKHQGQAHHGQGWGAGKSSRCGGGCGWKGKAGHHHRDQTQHFNSCEHHLYPRRCIHPQDVDGGQRQHNGKSPISVAVLSPRPHLAEIVAKHKGQQCDGAGVDHGGAGPCVQKRHMAAKSTVQKMIVTARMRVGGAQLGVAQGPHHRDQRTDQPNGHHPADIAGDAGHHGRGFENAGTNHNADDQGDCPQGAQQVLGLGVGVCGVAHRRLGSARLARTQVISGEWPQSAVGRLAKR